MIINPMTTPGLSHLFGFLLKMYQRLNHLEKVLLPTMAVGYKPLFSNDLFSHPNFHIAVLGMIAMTLAWNSLEIKQASTAGHHLRIIEPAIKAGGWAWAFVEIWQHLNSIPGVHSIIGS